MRGFYIYDNECMLPAAATRIKLCCVAFRLSAGMLLRLSENSIGMNEKYAAHE